MHVSPYVQIKQFIEQNDHEVDVLFQEVQAIKVYKKNHEKEIISFQYPGISQRLLLKVVYVKGNRIQRFFRSWEKSLCEKEFMNTLHFKGKGFTVPDPILYGEKRYWGMLRKGYYLTYEVSNSILFTDYLTQFGNSGEKEKLKEKRAILRNLGRYIGSMHACSLYHGTLMPHHFLLEKRPKGYKVYLIDFEYSSIRKKLSYGLQIKELRKLNKFISDFQKKGLITRSDRLRFIKEYWRCNPQLKAFALACNEYNFFKQAIKYICSVKFQWIKMAFIQKRWSFNIFNNLKGRLLLSSCRSISSFINGFL
jgi:tRNA A-37 threonylcarbamoyl transferase component Bud32